MKADARTSRIIALSRLLRLALLILAVLHPAIVFTVVVTMSDAQLAFAATGQPLAGQGLPFGTRMLVTGLSIVPALILSVGLLGIRPVLGDMQSGRAFGKAAFQGLRRLAIAVVISTTVKIVSVPLITMALTWQAEETQMAVSLGLGDLQMLILGAAIWLLAWVMAEGYDLTSENAQFV
ncbi:DUF2975 domain-containing protein [Pseudophaeobacter arcticus]|jgi:hypothetical protein|uniref:DUF2975 domain-containing protein n=1 Tax=Pseudophaeobacter arcticus TaxID=385492 RepID=UPI0039E69A9A